MPMTLRLLPTVLLLGLSHAATAKSVNPKVLDPVEDGAAYMLAEDYVYQEKAATFTLAAGRYVLRFQNERGAYLIGEEACLTLRVVPPKNPAAAWSGSWDCGIYLAPDPRKGASFFMIRRTPEKHEPSGQGWLVDQIIKAGYGSFDFPTSKREDVVLRGLLVPAVEAEGADPAAETGSR